MQRFPSRRNSFLWGYSESRWIYWVCFSQNVNLISDSKDQIIVIYWQKGRGTQDEQLHFKGREFGNCSSHFQWYSISSNFFTWQHLAANKFRKKNFLKDSVLKHGKERKYNINSNWMCSGNFGFCATIQVCSIHFPFCLLEALF